MKTHTPGPFPLKITQVDDFFVITTNQGNHYAKTFDPEAAHLIASAPELLEALEVVLSSTCGNVGDDGYEGCIRIEAKAHYRVIVAISKAKGKL